MERSLLVKKFEISVACLSSRFITARYGFVLRTGAFAFDHRFFCCCLTPRRPSRFLMLGPTMLSYLVLLIFMLGQEQHSVGPI